MRTTLFLLSAFLLAGCATHIELGGRRAANASKDGNAFWFYKESQGQGWQSRYLDYEQIAKDYARKKSLPFDFSGTSVALNFHVDEETHSLIAYALFSHGVGQQCLCVYIDRRGAVLRHQLFYDQS